MHAWGVMDFQAVDQGFGLIRRKDLVELRTLVLLFARQRRDDKHSSLSA